MNGQPEDPRRFAALRNRSSGTYIAGGALSMMADNIEHVLGYWVLWQTFHSPWLVGFQIVSHWLPFLLFSVYAGALAQRFDCRRIIQIAQALFMLVSICWGVLFLTGTLELWHACVLLVLHGLAGCLWMPAEQLMLYDFVGPRQLPSAVRINSTFRSLAFIAGPVVGSALLIGIGPAYGMFVNVLFYLPLTIFLFRTRFTGHGSAGRAASTTTADPAPPARAAAPEPVAAEPPAPQRMSFFAAFSVLGGFLLEATRKVPPTAPTAVGSAILLGISTVVFASSGSLVLAVIALAVGGVAKIASESTEMSIVQLQAPDAERGRVIGAYTMFGPGMMTFGGVTAGLLGSLLGIQAAVFVSGVVLTVGAAAVGAWLLLPRRGRAAAGAPR
ncbi:MFS transporter [Leucobacter chironomi]|uniref:MFS transporter n=1 Tax=Leucobacter chironomi TaxID=491918 RepID=UPI00040FC2C2|nr:MFS transporter [Leucobacter chironomi]